MKYLKKFETLNYGEPGEPEIGDFVLCAETENFSGGVGELKIFIENSIGKIIMNYFDDDLDLKYLVSYENVPEDLQRFFDKRVGYDFVRGFKISEIKKWSLRKSDLQEILNAQKFGI